MSADRDPFAGIGGQESAVDLLRRAAASGRVAHAYAFVGPPGTGRKAAALALAQALVAPQGGRDAGRIERGVHPDVRVIAPTAPEHNSRGPLALRVESVREVERGASLRPLESRWKVFIVEEADRMTAAAPQVFLKTLEEPPAHTVIVLILQQLRSLPATVLSRCQVVRFRPVAAEDAVSLLPAGRGAERDRALRWLAEVNAEGAEAIFKGGDALARDRPLAESMMLTWWLWYRDMLWIQAGGPSRALVFAHREDELRAAAARLSVDEVVGGLRAFRDAWQALQGQVNPRLTIEVLLSRLARQAA